MINPVLSIVFAVESCALDIYCFIAWVEVYVTDYSRFFSEWGLDGHAFKEGRRNQVDVLAGVGEEAHHGHGDKGAHGSAIVVAGETGVSG